MDFCDNGLFVVDLRLRLESFSAEEFEAIAHAVRGEQERRQCQANTLSVLPPARLRPEPERRRRLRQDLELVAMAERERREATERWTTFRITVERLWPQHHSPWTCEWCGAEWCKVRPPPAWARSTDDQPHAAVEVASSYGAPQVSQGAPMGESHMPA